MKRYSEDPVSKTPEKRSSRQIKPENSQIQNDILYDVLYFLEREEIEKKRLVSKQWNFNILAHDNILPLLIFKKLNYSQALGYKCWSILPKTKPTNRTNPINCNSTLLILEHIPDICLTKIICQEVVFNCQVCINNIVIANEVYLAGNNGNDLNVVDMRKNDILSFRKIMKNKGVKIKVIKASFILHGAQTKANVDREIEKISKLLNDHINTSKLHMEFAYSIASSYISNFTTASFNKPYESITLNFTCAYFDENLPIDRFLFIGNHGAKYYLLFDFNQFEMVVGKIIISNFMNYPNPEEMIHKVSFKHKIPHFKFFLMEELDKYIKKIILQNEIGRFPIKNFKDCEYNEDAEFKHFKIQRKDGWILNVDIPNFEKNINNSLCFHVLEFTIEKC